MAVDITFPFLVICGLSMLTEIFRLTHTPKRGVLTSKGAARG